MIKICAFVDGFQHYKEAIKEFQKRLGNTVELVQFKPSKKKEKKAVIKEETSTLCSFLQKQTGYIVLLSIGENTLSTHQFSQLLDKKQMEYGNVVFVIGGAYGLDETEIEPVLHQKMALSPMTFPHALALVLLYEQIYRAESIRVGRKYHH